MGKGDREMTVGELIEILQKIDKEIDIQTPESSEPTSVTLFYGIDGEVWASLE